MSRCLVLNFFLMLLLCFIALIHAMQTVVVRHQSDNGCFVIELWLQSNSIVTRSGILSSKAVRSSFYSYMLHHPQHTKTSIARVRSSIVSVSSVRFVTSIKYKRNQGCAIRPQARWFYARPRLPLRFFFINNFKKT